MYVWDVEPKERALIVRGEELYEFPDVPVSFGPVETTTHLLGSHGWSLFMRQHTPLHVTKTRPRVVLHPDGNRDFGFRWKFRARLPYKTPFEVFDDMANYKAFKFSLSKFQTKTIPVRDRQLEEELKDALVKVEMLRNANAALLKKDRDSLIPASFHPSVLDDKDALIERLQSELTTATAIQNMLLEDDEEVRTLKARIQEMEEDPFPLLAAWSERRVTPAMYRRPQPPTEPATVTPDNVIDLVERLRERAASDELDPDIQRRVNAALEA